jgi:hypothetical protein
LLLKRWLDRHPHVQPMAVAHQFPDWMLDAADIRIPPIPVPAGPPRDGSPPAPREKTGPLPGWYAVFVHQLRARHGRYEYFLRFQPTTTVGYTVTIYHISVEQANRVRRDLGLPDIGANQSRGSHDGTTQILKHSCAQPFLVDFEAALRNLGKIGKFGRIFGGNARLGASYRKISP